MIHQIEPSIPSSCINSISDYILGGGWLTEYKKTEEFEQRIAEFVGSKYCVVVTSGTVALYLALMACDVEPGDDVLIPNYTMIATPNAVRWIDATPILVDVDRKNLCMKLDKRRNYKHCKAMIYVPINGRSHDYDDVMAFCNKNDLILIEDACQAFGSCCGSKKLGTFGKVGIFSFTPHKIITTGQGGCIVTDDEVIYKKVKKLKDFGRISPGVDRHDSFGMNFKFTDLQAVIGAEQLKEIDYRILRKRDIYRQYYENLNDIVEFLPLDNYDQVPWFVDIIVPSLDARTEILMYLKSGGVECRPFYPPVNHQKIYSRFKRGIFPISEDIAWRGLWLPSSISLSPGQIRYVCGLIRKCVEQQK